MTSSQRWSIPPTVTLAVAVAMLGGTISPRASAEPVQQSGAAAADSLKGAGVLFERQLGPPVSYELGLQRRRAVALFREGFRDAEPISAYSAKHAFSATAGHQAGESTRAEHWLGTTLDDASRASKISFDPTTGHGRLKASRRVIGKGDRESSAHGASIVHSKSGERIFSIDSMATRYAATLRTPAETLQPRKVEGTLARFRARLALRSLPAGLGDAVVDGTPITVISIRTRTAQQPQRSLPPSVRPPTQTTRAVEHRYVVGGNDVERPITPSELAALKAAVARSKR